MGSWAKTLILRFYHWMLCGEQNGTLLSSLWDRNWESTLRSQWYCALHTAIAIHTFTLSKWSGLSLTPKINHKIIPHGVMKCYSIILWGEHISFTIVSQNIIRHFFSLAYFSGLIFILFLFCLMRLHREKGFMLMAAVEITTILCYRHFKNRSHVTLTDKMSFAIDLSVLK